MITPQKLWGTDMAILTELNKRIENLQKMLEDLNIVRREIVRKMDEGFYELKGLCEQRRLLESNDRREADSTSR